MVTGASNENGLAVPDEIEVEYADPFEEATPRKSLSWWHLRASFLAFKVSLEVGNENVKIADIQRNEEDGGKWRWDTPLFDKEVGELSESITSSKKFEAVWLKKQDGIYSVLDGHHRVIAWQRMGNETIPAVVVTVTPRKSAFKFQ